MDEGLMYQAVKEGELDVISAFATDGRIPAFELVNLEDDLAYFPPYYAAPVVRGDLLEEDPEVANILNKLAGKKMCIRDRPGRAVPHHIRGGSLMKPLVDLALVIRSKNAGPFELTIDIIFKERDVYERVKEQQLLNACLLYTSRCV